MQKNNTLVMLRVKPSLVKEKYLKNYYSSPELPSIKIKQLDSQELYEKQYDEDNQKAIFNLCYKSGTKVLVATNNYNTLGNCHYCNRSLSRLALIGLEPKGIIYNIDSKSNTNPMGISRNLFCNERCAYAQICKKCKRKPGDSRYSDAKYYTQSEYALRTGKELKPANSKKLLIINGGSLTDEQWDNGKYSYDPTQFYITVNSQLEETAEDDVKIFRERKLYERKTTN